jgi:hypothetical protein
MPGDETNHSPLSNAEVKKAWSYFSTRPCHQYAFMAWSLIKHSDNFIGTAL